MAQEWSEGRPKGGEGWQRLSLDSESLSKLVQSRPSTLGCGVEQSQEDKLSWLKGRLALNDEGTCKLDQKTATRAPFFPRRALGSLPD